MNGIVIFRSIKVNQTFKIILFVSVNICGYKKTSNFVIRIRYAPNGIIFYLF